MRGEFLGKIFMDLLSRYYLYLFALGFTVHSTKNRNNSINAYVAAVTTVADWESKTVDELAKDIDSIIPLYSKGGAKFSKFSKNNARIEQGLIHFKEFLDKKL